MSKLAVIGATGTIGKAVVGALGSRHDLIEVGATHGRYNLDSTDAASVRRFFETIGRVDGVVTTMGKVHFGLLSNMTSDQFFLGLRDKLMGQINVVLVGQSWINDGGSLTLTGGILAHHPIREGANASCVNMALEGFVRGAAIELPRGIRINLVSPTVLTESWDVYASYFRGFEPVSGVRTALGYVRSVEGAETGCVYRVGY